MYYDARYYDPDLGRFLSEIRVKATITTRDSAGRETTIITKMRQQGDIVTIGLPEIRNRNTTANQVINAQARIKFVDSTGNTLIIHNIGVRP